MIISHKYKFVVVDIPKTGTTSINHLLLPLLAVEDIFSYPCLHSQKIKTEAKPTQVNMRHSPYSEIVSKFLNVKSYFKFCFVRNPWDRVLSSYLYKKHIASVKISRSMSFNAYVKSHTSSDQTKYKTGTQFSYVDGFGDFSFIGRFENLQQDFDTICDKIGIPQQQLPHKNKTKHKHYTEYYDDETKQIVAKNQAQDIEYFGYKFGN